MLTTVQVRPVDSTGTLEPTRGQPFDIGRGTDKHTPDLRKLLIGLCIGQIIMVSAIAAVLGFFVNSHGIEIERLKEKTAKYDGTISTSNEQMAMIKLQNSSILEHSAKFNQLQTDVTGVQNAILSQMTRIDVLEGNNVTGNETAHDHDSRIALLESELNTVKYIVSNHIDAIERIDKSLNEQNSSIQRVNDNALRLESEITAYNYMVSNHTTAIKLLEKNLYDQTTSIQTLRENILKLQSEQTAYQYMVVNQTDITEQLEQNLHGQNSSIQIINEMVLQLKSDHEVDRDIVNEIKDTIRLLEENFTADANILQNFSSHLSELDKAMALASEMIQIQQTSHEQLKENMTAYSIDSIAFNTKLNGIEARTNASEMSLVDHDTRIGQLKLSHLSEITLNEAQATQIHELEDELNKTMGIKQGVIEGSTYPAVDGGWTDWTVWSSCSQTCGDGQMTRGRFCVNPMPANGGQDCFGSAEEQQVCNIGNCPVNGAWSAWSSWSGCSKICGPGLSKRQRTCTNPTPADNGHGCTGNSIDTQQCETRSCSGAKSAFTVHLPVASSAGMIKFSEVVNNIGSHYSTSTGRFTCQYPGIYVFHLHIMKEDLQSEAYCNIRKNSIDLITASSFTYGDTTQSLVSASTSAVVQLAQGDYVDLASCSHISTIRHGWETSFSGYLLQEI